MLAFGCGMFWLVVTLRTRPGREWSGVGAVLLQEAAQPEYSPWAAVSSGVVERPGTWLGACRSLCCRTPSATGEMAGGRQS